MSAFKLGKRQTTEFSELFAKTRQEVAKTVKTWHISSGHIYKHLAKSVIQCDALWLKNLSVKLILTLWRQKSVNIFLWLKKMNCQSSYVSGLLAYNK